VEINPPAAAAVVGAIARTSPALAPVAAATAASRQPRLASAIAKAAASAAPSQAAKIVAAVCRETPAQYLAVATAVAKAVPAASTEIIWAVSSALPSMKPYIDQVMALSTATSPSVATVLNQASKFAEASPSCNDPAIQPSYVAPTAAASRTALCSTAEHSLGTEPQQFRGSSAGWSRLCPAINRQNSPFPSSVGPGNLPKLAARANNKP